MRNDSSAEPEDFLLLVTTISLVLIHGKSADELILLGELIAAVSSLILVAATALEIAEQKQEQRRLSETDMQKYLDELKKRIEHLEQNLTRG